MIEIVGWRDSESNRFNLIDWDIEVLGPFSPLSSISGFGAKETLRCWGSFSGSSWLSGGNRSSSSWSWGWISLNNNILSSSWLFLMVVLLVMVLFVVLFVILQNYKLVIPLFKSKMESYRVNLFSLNEI